MHTFACLQSHSRRSVSATISHIPCLRWLADARRHSPTRPAGDSRGRPSSRHVAPIERATSARESARVVGRAEVENVPHSCERAGQKANELSRRAGGRARVNEMPNGL